MLRTLFMPRLLGLHLLVIGVLISFTLLGRWQLGVFEDSGRPQAAADPAPVDVTTLTQVGAAFQADSMRRRVTAEGAFDGARQLLVADRTPDSARAGGRAARGQGFWLLTPLRLTDGTTIPVVRGWVATPEDPAAAAVPEGTVTVSGRLMPPEPTDSVQRTGRLPEGQVATVSTAELINIWAGERLRNGYVIATEQVAGSASAPRLVAVSPPTLGRSFNWRNLAYALQWWIFAGFAVFMWYRLVREAVRQEKGRATGGDGTASADAGEGEPAAKEAAATGAVRVGERPPGAR